jgi:hypothetical protein
MVMIVSSDTALVLAGIVGSAVALIHGAITQRLMVAPLREATVPRFSGVIRRIVPPLLHFSTFNWFVGGLALVAVALWGGPEAKLVAGLLVGSSYLFGAAGNLWATRGRHPGWALYTLALGLIAYGLSGQAPGYQPP